MPTDNFSEPDEIWYPIPDFPGYEFSSNFRIRSCHHQTGLKDRWHLIKPHDAHGYTRIMLQRDGVAHGITIQWIVTRIIYGPKPQGMQILHRDDDRSNNYASNLYYGTAKDNGQDRIQNGRAAHGVTNANSKLNDDAIFIIQNLRTLGWSHQRIANAFGVATCPVALALSRKTWKHVPRINHHMPLHAGHKLNESDIREIRRLYASGVKRKEISARFSISMGTVSQITTRKAWAHLP